MNYLTLSSFMNLLKHSIRFMMNIHNSKSSLSKKKIASDKLLILQSESQLQILGKPWSLQKLECLSNNDRLALKMKSTDIWKKLFTEGESRLDQGAVREVRVVSIEA